MVRKRIDRRKNQRAVWPGPLEAGLLLALGSSFVAAGPARAEENQPAAQPASEGAGASPTAAAPAAATTPAAPKLAPGAFPVEEVTVTARHMNESIQDVPLAVSIMGGEAANDQKVEKLTEFSQFIPNLNPVTANPRTSSVSVRGIGGIQGGSDGAESGVGLIVDDVFFTHIGYAWADYVDLESFQVARGPQGTLLGKNTTVGAVIITTQKPSFTPSASLETSYGSLNTTTERASVTGPIIDNQLAFRATYYGSWGDGVLTNGQHYYTPQNTPIPRPSAYGPTSSPDGIGNGASLGNTDRWGVRLQFLATPNADMSDRVIIERLGSDEYDNYGRRIHDPLGKFDAKIQSVFGLNVSNDLTNNGPDLAPIATHTSGISNNFAWDLGGSQFTSISAYRQFYFNPHNSTGSSSGSSGFSVTGSSCSCVDTSQFSQEFRLASTGKRELDWQTGVYFLRENTNSNAQITYGADSAPFLIGKNVDPAVLDGLMTNSNGKASTTSAAVFAQPTWHVDDQLALTFGLRNTFERRRSSNTSYTTGGQTLTNPNDIAARINYLESSVTNAAYQPNGLGYALTDGKSNDSLSYLVNPSYRFNDNAMVYFSYGVGEKSGAININAKPLVVQTATGAAKMNANTGICVGEPGGICPTAVVGTQPGVTLPEKALDYEVGTKTNWFNNKLTVNGNLFLENINHYQSTITTYASTPNGPQSYSYYSNIGGAQISGFELEGVVKPVTGLNITYAASSTKAIYTDYKNAGAPNDFPSTVKTVDLTGTRFLNIPAHAANIGAFYEQPVGAVYGKDFAGFAYVNEAWQDTVHYANPASAYQVNQTPFSTVNVGFGIRSEDDQVSLTFWGKNILDRHYITGYTAGSSNAPAYVVPGLPGLFGVTLKIKFS